MQPDSVPMRPNGIDLDAFRAAVAQFPGAGADRSWQALLDAVGAAPDLSRRQHRHAVRRWLNGWGCRIRYPRPGEPDVFDAGLARWWRRWAANLPARGVSVIDLDDATIALIAPAFRDLVDVPAAAPPRARTLGPTAAAKLLYALRPRTLMPWDEAIALALHGVRTADAYAAHQAMARDWGSALLAQTGLAEDELASSLGRSGRSLVKLLDEYCYLVHTAGWRP